MEGRRGALMALVMVGIVLWSTRSGAAEVTEVTMRPKVVQAQAGMFHPEAAPALLVGHGLLTGAEKRPAAFQPLLERLQARYGSAVSPAAPTPQLPSGPYVLIGLAHDHPALARLIAAHHAALPKKGLGPEGYALEVTPDHVLIAAERPAGAFYGALQLLGLDTATAKDIEVPAGVTLDWPDMAWRGMHLLVNGRFDLADLQTLLTRSLPQLRMNGLILELDYHFQFKSHPEMADANGLTREDCRHLKDLADRNFVRLIPMINCLGHQSWSKTTGRLLKAHPEFDETPDAPADNKGIYCRSWCPSHPDINRFACDLIDEMVDAFHADAFHVGMDEVFILGQCPRCKGKDNAHLFAKAVNDLHAHIVGKRKLQMLMWGDRLLDGKATGYGEWEASENGTAPAIDLIPKDIVLCDWHYETRYDDRPATYPSVALFQQKGLKVWPSAWRSVENVQLLVHACQQGRTDRMVGYLATTWNGVRPIVAGLEGDIPPAGDRESTGVVAAIRAGAKLSWEGTPTAP